MNENENKQLNKVIDKMSKLFKRTNENVEMAFIDGKWCTIKNGKVIELKKESK